MITVKHEGIEIQYNETRNRWTVDDAEQGVTLERSSLEEAKKSITQALKNKGKGRFTRFNAWTTGRYGNARFVLVMVTSLVELVGLSYIREEAWVTYPKTSKSNPKREKLWVSDLYKDTAVNRKRIAKITELRAQMHKLSGQATNIEDTLDRVTVKGEKK